MFLFSKEQKSLMDSKGRTRRSKRLRQKDNASNPDQSELFEGLEIDDGYVKIDSNLLKRLKRDDNKVGNEVNNEVNNEQPIDTDAAINRIYELFNGAPEYADMLIHARPLDNDTIDSISSSLSKNHWHKKMGEMVANIPLEFLALQRTDAYTQDYEYRYKPACQPRVTNQYHSGRCWMFASLNVLRYGLIFKLNLDPKFEFSASYLFFWDKIERSKLFYESIWSLRNHPLDERYNNALITNDTHIIKDGGYWNYFQNLVKKYGLMPKSIYNDSYNCLCSDDMNDALIKVLNQDALTARGIETRDQFDEYLNERMNIIYGLVVKFMGEPPTKFDWRYKTECGQYQEIKNLTPSKFYNVVVPHDTETKMTFIHDPRHPENYYKPHHVEYGTNMVGGETAVFINIPIDVMKYGISESLINGEPVWYACDVGACLDGENGIMDINRYDYKRVLGVNTIHSKSDMLTTKTSVPSHAMVINGVDMDEPNEDTERTYRKWRIDNSWGCPDMEWHPDHGCWQMSDDWFDQYVYMAVIDLKYFEEETLRLIMDNKSNPCTIKPWDAFGVVAINSGCNSCKCQGKK